MKSNLLNKNFNKPSNVWAKLAIVVPMASNAVPMTPKMALKIDWKTARTEPSAAVMVWKIPATRLLRDSTREGIATMLTGWDVSLLSW